jgi:hypothetical protein
MKPTKRTAKLANRKRERAHKRTKNPAFDVFKVPNFMPADSVIPIDIKKVQDDGFSRMAADLMVSASLVNATPSEKMLIATLIPTFLEMIRPKKKSSKPSKTTPGRTDGPEAQRTAE